MLIWCSYVLVININFENSFSALYFCGNCDTYFGWPHSSDQASYIHDNYIIFIKATAENAQMYLSPT